MDPFAGIFDFLVKKTVSVVVVHMYDTMNIYNLKISRKQCSFCYVENATADEVKKGRNQTTDDGEIVVIMHCRIL